MEQTHTPTPYICAAGPSMHGWPIVNSEGRMIAQLPLLPDGFPNKKDIDQRILATGQFIVRACNSHYDLFEALHMAQKTISMLISPDAIKSTTVVNAWAQLVETDVKLRKVLAKARGEQ